MKSFAIILIAALVLFSQHICKADYRDNSVRFSIARVGGPALDPHRVQGDLELHLFPNIFEGLLKIDPSSGELIPALALDYKWISPVIVEFNLRRGVKFHNGEDFDAAAVKFSFDRMLNVKDGFNWIKAIVPEFKEVEILSPFKVRIHFTKHNSVFLISSRFLVMLPPKLINEEGSEAFLKHPIGTGPFQIHDIERGKDHNVRKITLLRNPNYWQQYQPSLDRVEFHFGETAKASVAAFVKGDYDAIANVPLPLFEAIKPARGQLKTKGQGLLVWLYFNLSKYKNQSPLWDRRVREAILHAINYPKLIEDVFQGKAVQNNQWAFIGLPGYDQTSKNYNYDPEQALKLLSDAGYPNGFTLHAYSDDVSTNVASFIQSNLNDVGINVILDELDEATNNCILTARRNPSSPCHEDLKKYDFMIGDFGWGLPHNYVSHLHTFSLRSFASMVSESYPDAYRTIEMFDAARNSFGDKESNESWAEITRYELNRLSIAGIVEKESVYAVVPNLDMTIYGAFDFSKTRYINSK